MKLVDRFKILVGEKSSSYETLFLSATPLPVQIDKKVNIVLSPSLYWFREESLPAKNSAVAKKLAPSFFDTVIGEGEYEYMAIKVEDKFWLFAYNNAAIAQALDDAGISPAQVHAVYFAQTECADTDEPLSADENHSLVSYEGVVSLVPKRYSESFRGVDEYCAQHARSKHRVSINFYSGGVLSEKQIFTLTLISILFLVLYLGDYLLQKHQFKQQLIQQYALKEHYNLPKTSFELKSLISTLQEKQEHQKVIRERFREILKMPLKEKEALVSLDFSAKRASLEIDLSTAKRAEVIKKYLQNSAKIRSPKVQNKTFFVGLVYE